MTEIEKLISDKLCPSRGASELDRNYSTNMTLAWQIVEKMQQDFDGFGLQLKSKFWTAWVVKRGFPSISYQVEMPGTAMESICELAIVAYQLRPNTTTTPHHD